MTCPLPGRQDCGGQDFVRVYAEQTYAAESTFFVTPVSKHPIVLVLVVAVAAPLLAEIPIGLRVPIVIFEVLLGIVIGPHVLGLARADNHAVWPDAVAFITRPYLFLSARCVR